MASETYIRNKMNEVVVHSMFAKELLPPNYSWFYSWKKKSTKIYKIHLHGRHNINQEREKSN